MAKADPKSMRTVDAYKELAADIRICEKLLRRVDQNGIVRGKNRKKLDRALVLLNEARSELEECMFQDHPELGNEYTHVFYGPNLFHADEDETCSELEAEMSEIARTAIERTVNPKLQD